MTARLPRSTCCRYIALLALTAGAAARAQAPVPTEPPAETVQQYEVEILIFAHEEFDPSEELFEHRREQRDAAAASRALTARALQLDELELRSFDPPETLQPADTRLPNDPDQGISATRDGIPGLPQSTPPAGLDRGLRGGFRFRPLRADELELGREYGTLQRLGAYTPILHGGWVQEGLAENEARAFNLALLGARNPNGSIRLHVSRFLHLTIDLSYQPLGLGATAPRADSFGLGEFVLAPRYMMRESRSVRSGELHYFDHPAFGMLVVLRPVEAEAVPSGAPRPAA
jgi:hypothetical protein